MEKIPLVTIYNLIDWRNWLERNHLKEIKVGLILYKKHTGKPSISHREAMEEAGIRPLDLELFAISHCGGSFDWDLYYFMVKSYEEVGQSLEEHEKIEMIKVSKDELQDFALSGKIQEDRSVSMILKYLHQRNK